MQSTEEKPVLRYDNIFVSPRGVAEVHGSKTVILIPAEEISRINLKFGRAEHRPIFSMSIGLILVLVGLAGLVEFFLAMQGYRYELGMMAFGILGGSMVHDTLKQRYFLEVQKTKGMARLVFSKNALREGVQDFCKNVTATYGHQITDAP
jgi:hypothetical protein